MALVIHEVSHKKLAKDRKNGAFLLSHLILPDWLRLSPTLVPVLQEEDLRSESRWQLSKGQKGILVERKGEYELGSCPPGPHPLGVCWQ